MDKLRNFIFFNYCPDLRQSNFALKKYKMKKNQFIGEVLKDSLFFIGVLLLLLAIYTIVEYWPHIVDGFNKGWNSR